MLTRRWILTGLAAVVLAPGTAHARATQRPESRLDALTPAITPALDLRNVHTNERLTTRYHGPTGYDMEAIRQINWVMRDHRAREATQMDVRLLWALSAITMAAQQEGYHGPILLLSGYRTQATNQMLRSRGIRAARNSFHLSGQAADIRLQGIPSIHVSHYARWLEVGGVGHYGRSNFTHIDSGGYRRWGW